MAIQRWQDLSASVRARLLAQRSASLWILPNATLDDVLALAGFQWVNVWNSNPEIDVQTILESGSPSRTAILVSSSNDDIEEFSARKFFRLYTPVVSTDSKFGGLREFQTMQLKARVSTAVGLVVLVGRIDDNTADIPFISDLAPQVHLVGFAGRVSALPVVAEAIAVSVFENSEEFISVFRPNVEQSSSVLANLKDTENLVVNEDLLESLEQNWTFLTADRVSESPITQERFDNFLNGEAEWQVYSAGAAYQRALENRIEGPSNGAPHARYGTLTEQLSIAIHKIERATPDPRNSLRQIRIFSEPGSGTTTCLRQAAVDIARLGHPVLMSNPSSKDLTPQTVTQFVIDAQDRWRDHRSGAGSGHGNIPFVIFLDKDVDEQVEPNRLARALAGLGREVLLIRAFERSRDEISRAKDVLCLRADVSENDMLAIGAHLRQFARRNGLAPVPTDDEWRAYHRGLNRVE
jgi:hypothetical protein